MWVGVVKKTANRLDKAGGLEVVVAGIGTSWLELGTCGSGYQTVERGTD